MGSRARASGHRLPVPPRPAPSLACFAFFPPTTHIELSQTYPEPTLTRLFTGHRRLATKLCHKTRAPRYSLQPTSDVSDAPYYIRLSTLVGAVWSHREPAVLQSSHAHPCGWQTPFPFLSRARKLQVVYANCIYCTPHCNTLLDK
jgi:hypothetical protein